MQTEALRANLERTAVEVEIPPEHRVLLEITEPLRGVHDDTERLLREIHHTFVGWAETLAELHRRAMGDLYHYNAHPRGAEGVQVYCDLYAKVVGEATPDSLRVEALRMWLRYLLKIAVDTTAHLERNLSAVGGSLAALEHILLASPRSAAQASAGLKRLVAALAEAGAVGGEQVAVRSAGLLRSVLDSVYAMWLAHDDPAAWFAELRASADDDGLPDAVAAISHASLEAHRLTLEGTAPGEVAEILGFPDHAVITRAYLDAADALDGALDERTRWLSRVLGEELLTPIHERALWSLARSCRTLVAHADRDQFERFISDVFATLRREDVGANSAALDLVRRIGTAVLESPDPTWTDLVIDEILTLDFQGPGFLGFTDEWSVRINPNHLKNIRAFLGIIEADPAASRRLLAALVIHLEMGGVFIADTDLFQKDVSNLLAADIGPVYHQVRDLLRRLPVYFNDIGAEGELRDVSTRIDEITGRRDPICHFLRKQCHVESNPALIAVVDEVARFWATGDGEQLRPYLPEEIHGHLDVTSDEYRGLHDIFSRLAGDGADFAQLFDAPTRDVDDALDALGDVEPVAREKAGLLFRLRRELARKYALDHGDVLDRLRDMHRIEPAQIDRLDADLSSGRREAALGEVLDILEQLQTTVLDPDATEAVEDIYHKRHIGTGIPSMYGRYREDRLDAIGLSFRLESLAGSLLDWVVADGPIDVLDDEALRRVHGWLGLLARALSIEGFRSEALTMSLSMLEDALALPNVTREELIDVFRGISHSVRGIVRRRILDVYGDLFEDLGPILVARGDFPIGEPGDGESVIRAGENFLRGLIAQSLALQRIDNVAGGMLQALSDPGREWVAGRRNAVDGEFEIVAIHSDEARPGPLQLGNKGFMLGRLADYRFPIPPGFIVSTALSRAWASGSPERELPGSVVDRVRDQLAALEQETGARFGDPERPLLLSVRAGAPISMPGMLDSFLNVGINPDVVEGLASMYGSPWAAWDGYRRFLQFWGMSRGLDRDLFDELMHGAKRRYSAKKKALLAPGEMRELAGEYRALLSANGVDVVDEPFEQLLSCIRLVLGSWDSAMARVYRGELSIADGWGTAVIVQNMVFGNLNSRSGTGVLLTHHPQRDLEAFELYGDFVIQGQGDDVVSGLVQTFPISHRQHPAEARAAGVSLERMFPAIYRELERLGRPLVEEHGWSHQEIEFTFESEDPADLFILQARETVTDGPAALPQFVLTSKLTRSRLAVGIGVGGGAISCRVAQNEADIVRLRFEHPGDPVLLVRRDTVPDDIHLLLQSDAVLTAIGGATSHAAVVAKRLGRTCVVGCRQLRVYEAERRTEIAGQPIETGDWISISGLDGTVYLGRHEVQSGAVAGGAAARIGASV